MRGTRILVRLVLLTVSLQSVLRAESAGPVVPVEIHAAAPAMVIGFLGGFVKHDARAHSTVQVVEHLRNSHREGVYVQSFANRQRNQAYQEIRRRLDRDNDGTLSPQEK